MKLQVWGAKGMLGSKVCDVAVAAGHTVLIGPSRLEMAWEHDVTAPTVINCAGRTKQNTASNSDYILDNAYGPHNLAEACSGVHARLIHVSTDCVFVGGGPHLEDELPDGTDIYALSKRAGEVTYGPHLTIRTSFVGFGSRGLIHDLQTQRSIKVSQNLLWSGHTVDYVASLLVWLADHPHITGLLHVPGTDQNRYTLARDLKARWNLPAKLDRDDEFAADRRLVSEKWDYLGLPPVPSFTDELDAMRGPDAGI